MRLIDADSLREIWVCLPGHDFEPSSFVYSIDNAPTVEPALPWHRVEDGLPEKAGIYIICDHYGNVMSRHFCKKGDRFAGYWHFNGSKYYGNPTHWMPLPEPPKEGNDA